MNRIQRKNKENTNHNKVFLKNQLIETNPELLVPEILELTEKGIALSHMLEKLDIWMT